MFRTGNSTSRNIINIIQDERVAGGGLPFSQAEKDYVHTIVQGMMNIGTWDLSTAIYGFIGGTAASHKWNWKDMRDLDAAFRLTFPVAPTHNSLGVQGNGNSQYCNTHIVSATDLPTSISFSTYYNQILLSSTNDTDLGATSSGTGVFFIQGAASNRRRTYYSGYGTDNYLQYNASNDAAIIGYNYNGYTPNTSLYIHKGLIVPIQITQSIGGTKPTVPFFLMAFNNNGTPANFSRKRFAFASVKSNMTEEQAFKESHLITYAQGILGRK